MKGKVLSFNENEGIILGKDEKRYKFTLDDWRENSTPQKGDEVDFEVDKENAKNIYLLAPSNNSLQQLPPQTKQILSQAGLLGGLGIIGLFLGWIPLIGAIISIAGIVSLLMGVYKISKLAPKKQIFRNFLYAYIIIPLFFIIIGGIIIILLANNLNENVLIAIMWILIVIPMFVLQAIYYKKAFLGIYEVTGIDLFQTTAKMFYWGSLLAIIGIGIFILLVAWIIAAIAFFSLRK